MNNPVCISAALDIAEKNMAPSDYIHPDTILDGEANERACILMTSADEKFIAGVWECSPCKERVDSYPGDEFMTVLEGSVTLTDSNGSAQTYAAGESFCMPKGWSGTWHMTAPFKKYFVLYLS